MLGCREHVHIHADFRNHGNGGKMMAVTPPELIASNLHVGPKFLHALQDEESPVVMCPWFS
ncbi:hypothetical protein [Sporomusa acidovorans]|uniref:hypothetical protein n=1 Tax=Sporomusa acidovorans TaxID=112900 RepID=UPI00146B060B|nr:hypothetical protein [Sporomusa acidovorans]